MRLLICTLYFPPCTLTPANRTYSWAKYLNQFGIYPVIITRQWPATFTTELYEERSIGKDVVIEKHDNYEVHYVPFPGSYVTRSLEKHGAAKNKMARRISLVFGQLLRNMFNGFLPYKNLIRYALDYVRDNKVDKMLISGSPFQLFKIGYLANKRYHVPWIADYRDGWTSGNHNYPQEIIGKLERVSNKYFERKWLRTAERFITVSRNLKECIEDTIGKRGEVVYNGFFDDNDAAATKEPDKTNISFLYSGSMYFTQDYVTLVEVFKKLIGFNKGRINIKLIFLGTVYKNEPFQNDPVFEGYRDYFILQDRVSYVESLKIHAAVDVFVALAYRGAKGIPSSKLFDYIKFHKPVLLFPSDHDVLEEILTGSGLGIIAEDAAILEQQLQKLIDEKMATGKIASAPDTAYINSFSRENQARVLASIIKESVNKGNGK